MKLLLIIPILCAFVWGKVIPNDRIIGGERITIEKRPYIVSLRYGDRHACGGSIVNENTIVTATHCILGLEVERTTIRAGSSFHNLGEEYSISSMHPNEDFGNGAIGNNDIAVIKLSRNLTFSSGVQPIPLQPSNTPVPEGTIATISGWGTTNPIPIMSWHLRTVDVDIISNQQCEESYEDISNITSVMICAMRAGKDACQGDSGGPLVANGRLVGVVSWGEGCADPDYPGIYANVSALRTFVDQYL